MEEYILVIESLLFSNINFSFEKKLANNENLMTLPFSIFILIV